jgi:hypothetical protein
MIDVEFLGGGGVLWSGKVIVSRKVMMSIVVAVASGRMMNFNDC